MSKRQRRPTAKAADLLRAKVGDKRTSASREHHGAGSDGVHQRLRQVPDGVLDAARYERMQRICMSKWQDETSKWQSGKEEGIGDEGSEWAPCLQWWELPLRRSDCQTADDQFLFDCALALVKGCHLRTFAQKSKSGKLHNFFINALVRAFNNRARDAQCHLSLAVHNVTCHLPHAHITDGRAPSSTSRDAIPFGSRGVRPGYRHNRSER